MASENLIGVFANSCVFARSTYLHFQILFQEDGRHLERMSNAAPTFFGDVSAIFREYLILQACKFTDAAKSGSRENLTAPYLLEHYRNELSGDFSRASQLNDALQEFRKLILSARHKIISHTDLATIQKRERLGVASQERWGEFWKSLDEFVSTIYARVHGTGMHILEVALLSDADELVQALRRSIAFQKVMRDGSSDISRLCAEAFDNS